MRVVLVCPYSWTAHGGVQSHVRGLAGQLRREGVTAWVVAPADAPAGDPFVVAVGATVRIRHNGSVVPVALAPAAARRALAAIGALRPDVVHVHEPFIPAVALAAIFADGPATVATFHRYARRPGAPYRAFGALCRAGARRIDVRIAVSEAARRHAAATCPGHYEVVPNGIRAGPAPPARAGDGPGRIAFVGRGDRRKGIPVLLDAFARLPGAPWLDVVGAGEEDLRGALGRLPPPVRARVVVHGPVADGERDRILRAADLFCCPALRGESFGIVVAEAMAAGLPVVATDVGGVPELVGPDGGRVVPAGDAAALAAALGWFLLHPGERRAAGRAARARAAALDWTVVAPRVLAAYERALARATRRGWANPTIGPPARPTPKTPGPLMGARRPLIDGDRTVHDRREGPCGPTQDDRSSSATGGSWGGCAGSSSRSGSRCSPAR